MTGSAVAESRGDGKSENLLDAALQYAGRGWKIFPLRPRGKVPLISKKSGGRGLHDATADRVTVEAWWRRWPDANIGLACGASQLAVLDIDGAEGLAELKALTARFGPLPPTLTARTGSGAHVFFALAPGESVKSSARGKLHVRSEGGYVVIAPSVHPNGRRYEWINSLTIAVLPSWLKEWMSNGSQETQNQAGNLQGNFPPAYLVALPSRNLSQTALRAIKQVESTWSLQEQNRIESALKFINPKPHDIWRDMGMALKSLQWFRSDGLDVGFEIWDEWSQGSSSNYPGVDGLLARWNSFDRNDRGDKIGIGTLFHYAKDAGWQDAPRAQPVGPDSDLPSGVGIRAHEQLNGPGVNGHVSASAVLPPEFSQPTTSEPARHKHPLTELNEKYTVIGNVGGKCLVMSWVNSNVSDTVKVPSFQSFKSFAERHANQYVSIKSFDKKGNETEKFEQLGAHWLKWSGRPIAYNGLDLAPGNPIVLPGNVLNLWRGFAVQPAAGGWGLMKAHIRDVLAAGDMESARYILRFAAWAVQHPGERAEVALVLRGGKGTGKGTFANALVQMFGAHGLHVYNRNHLIGGFNGHLRSCLLLFADEAFWAGDKAGESILKGMLTEPDLMIEQKGVDAIAWKNRLHVIMAANAEWVVPASHDERRYAVFNVSDEKQSGRYFDALYDELRRDGLAAMLYDLARLQLGDWHPRQIVQTAALQEQKERSLDPLHEWWEGILQRGELPCVALQKDMTISAAEIYKIAREETPRLRDVSRQRFGRFLHSMGCEPTHRASGEHWEFRPLNEMRKLWQNRFVSWPWREEIPNWRKPSDFAEKTSFSQG